jgi:hypothetical protein
MQPNRHSVKSGSFIRTALEIDQSIGEFFCIILYYFCNGCEYLIPVSIVANGLIIYFVICVDVLLNNCSILFNNFLFLFHHDSSEKTPAFLPRLR